jgi:hypothetical protein
MAARQISEDSESKLSFEEARIAEVGRIVAEADATIAAKLKELGV